MSNGTPTSGRTRRARRTDQTQETEQADQTPQTVGANLRPTRVSGALSVLFGLGALLWLDAGAVWTPLAIEGVGLVALMAGVTLVQRDHRLAGGALVAAGLGTVVGAVAVLAMGAPEPAIAVQFGVGMVGPVLLALGVAPWRASGSRRLVKAGSALVFISVCATGVVEEPELGTLLPGAVLAVLAWDAGEYAIGLGRQLGRRARTYPTEAVHAVGSVAVAVGTVVAGRAVDGLGSPGLPLDVFVLLVIGLVLLAGALHN